LNVREHVLLVTTARSSPSSKAPAANVSSTEAVTIGGGRAPTVSQDQSLPESPNVLLLEAN